MCPAQLAQTGMAPQVRHEPTVRRSTTCPPGAYLCISCPARVPVRDGIQTNTSVGRRRFASAVGCLKLELLSPRFLVRVTRGSPRSLQLLSCGILDVKPACCDICSTWSVLLAESGHVSHVCQVNGFRPLNPLVSDSPIEALTRYDYPFGEALGGRSK